MADQYTPTPVTAPSSMTTYDTPTDSQTQAQPQGTIAEQPAPPADPVLAQVLVEDERALLHGVVLAEPLGHAVQEHLVGLAHVARQRHLGLGHGQRIMHPAGRVLSAA